MPRNLVVGNGNLLVNFDTDYNVRDIYYPYVGMENHASGCVSRTGIWVDGKFAWIASPEWQKEMTYESETLVTRVIAVNPTLGLTLTFSDLVDFDSDLRNLLAESCITEQRSFLKSFVERIDVGDSEIKVYYTIPMPPSSMVEERVGVLPFVHHG